ncbi:MAG: 6-hydroxymethylpterin diphosphokinase MptE-like protein [Thermodesulfobacteriota bacterium]
MIEIIDNGQCEPGLIYNGVVLHDGRDPMNEARFQTAELQASEADIILVFGVGLGYHLRALRERWPRSRITAYEPAPEIKEAFMARTDVLDFGPDRLNWLEDLDNLGWLVTREIVRGDAGQTVALISPGYKEAFPREADLFSQIISEARIWRAVIEKTAREKNPLFLANLLTNLPTVMKLPCLAGLSHRLTGWPGFIVGSGPSLEKNGHLLRRLEGRGLILAAGSAYRPLLDMGVRPDMVVILEAEDTSHFLGLGPASADVVLALASAAHPHHFQVQGFTLASFHLTRGASFLFGSPDHVPQGGTSGSAAFTLGLLLGLNPLVLLGQDQAFPYGRVHLPGTPGDVPLTPDMTAFSVRGSDGTAVNTHSGFIASLHWFAESINFLKKADPARVVLNASETGAHIPGVPDASLNQVIDALTRSSGGVPRLTDLLVHIAPPEPDQVRRRLDQTGEMIAKLSFIHRRAPDQAGPALAECRAVNPLLDEILFGLDKTASTSQTTTAFEEAEKTILAMLEALD